MAAPQSLKFKLFFFSRFFVILLSTFYFLASSAEAATLYLSPANATYSVNKNFTVSVRVNTSQAMNAAEGVVNFPTDKLRVVAISKAGSIFNLWVQEPSYSNSGSLGNVRFEGVVLNPGFTGDGKILEITFSAKSEGLADVTFASGSVLANDGQGTNILSSLNGASYTIQKSALQTPEIVSPGSLPPKPTLKHFVKASDGELILLNTSDNEDPKWTNSSFAKLVWIIPSEVAGLATYFSDSPDSNPGTKSEGVFDNKTYKFLEDGRHYFHIRFINAKGGGPILHYPLFVDTAPPEEFKITFLNGDSAVAFGTSNPRPEIDFSATDSLSGIDRYEIKIGNEPWMNAGELLIGKNIYRLPKQKPGTRTIFVRAFDRAGNYTDAETQLTIEPIVSPQITDYPKRLTSPGEKLMIAGTASPLADVEVRLSKNRKSEPLILSAKADKNGNWSLVYDNVIPSGTYAITAKQILENGAESLETAPVYVRVNSLFWSLWQWLKNIGGFFLLLLILLLIILVIIYYMWHRFKIWRMKLRKEAREAQSALEKGMKQVKEEVLRGESRQKIAKDIEKIEKNVEKEIKDIK